VYVLVKIISSTRNAYALISGIIANVLNYLMCLIFIKAINSNICTYHFVPGDCTGM